MISKNEVYDFIDSIKKKLPIDGDDLTHECMRQPLLYEEVSSMASLSRSECNRKKEELEAFRSKLNIAIRENPEKYITGKVTESAITNTIESDEEFLITKNEYLDYIEITGALDSLLRTVEQRKSMLRDLVQLWIFQYYSAESSRPVSTRQVKQANEEAVANVREEGRRRRKSSEDHSDLDDRD
jgi:hypothetical protein